ncbi:MAG: zinc-binding dehydrogenase [Thermomicrobiales bacterium]|nr:zinc-binding dehydrogenase [Thermomicrobiales bacterium]
MTAMMKHYYVVAPGEIGCIEEPVPAPGAGEVQVRITHTAISPGSNVYIYQTGSYTGQWEGKPQECIYMGAGVVSALGEGVTELQIGDAVSVGGVGHQAYAVAPLSRVHKLPEGVSTEEGSLSYLSGWAVSALHLGRYAAAETVLVVGLGLVGASAALAADMMGARVIGVDVAPERVAYGRQLGLTAIIDGAGPDAVDQIGAAAGKRGVDLILETSGSWSGFELAFNACRDYTRIALMGLYRRTPSAEQALRMHQMLYGFPSKLHYKKIDIVGCGYDPENALPDSPFTFTRGGNYSYLLEQAGRGKIDLTKLVTHRFESSEVGDVLQRFAEGDRSMVGAVFSWQDG